jgi:hypothetical protein
MADNVTAPGTGIVFKTDELAGGVHVPISKLAFGPPDTATDVTSATPLPVVLGLTDAQLRASAVSVSGPLTDVQLRAAAVPVAGPLTDSQLRASAVSVSGPLTDAQLRASAVPVAGPLTDSQLRASAVSVSGPLTDVQLRAAPVPVAPSVLGQTVAQPTFAGTRATVTGTATTAAALPALGASRRLRLRARAACLFRSGDGTVVAAADGNSLALDAGSEVIVIPAGHTHFSVIRDTEDGVLDLMPLAG